MTDHCPNLLAIPNTNKIENKAPAKAALVRNTLPAPNKMAESAPTAAPPEIPNI